MSGLLAIFFVPIRAVIVLVTLASVSVMILTASQRSERPFNPFARYPDILAGQSLDAVEQEGFICKSIYSVFSLQESCSLTPETGMFSEIEVLFASDTGQVNRVIFRTREKMLTIGDLVMLWGKPEIAVNAGIANLRWRDAHIVAIPQNYRGHFSYLLPIRYVAFEAAD